MATTKKTAPKKKAIVKKPMPKSVAPEVRSFRVASSDTPFFTIRFTHQSLYWSILAIIVIALGAWVIWNSVRINDIYNQIDSESLTESTVRPLKNTTPAE